LFLAEQSQVVKVPVLELEASPDAALQAIRAEAKAALAEDAIDAIILGCGGMVHVSDALNAELPIPVIDPVVAAAQSMTWLAER
jgi:allantoin racemase